MWVVSNGSYSHATWEDEIKMPTKKSERNMWFLRPRSKLAATNPYRNDVIKFKTSLDFLRTFKSCLWRNLTNFYWPIVAEFNTINLQIHLSTFKILANLWLYKFENEGHELIKSFFSVYSFADEQFEENLVLLHLKWLKLQSFLKTVEYLTQMIN